MLGSLRFPFANLRAKASGVIGCRGWGYRTGFGSRD